ncbi:MAG TPA: hypothetical protein VFK30_12450, partial [Anaerolineae bacterium]|nr:hypothetical protein [Anaerolineae bacterium]
PVSPDSIDWYIQMFSAPLPSCDATQIKTRLYDEFRVEVPIVMWQGNPYIRVSIQAYNTGEDVDRLIEALQKIFNSSVEKETTWTK